MNKGSDLYADKCTHRRPLPIQQWQRAECLWGKAHNGFNLALWWGSPLSSQMSERSRALEGWRRGWGCSGRTAREGTGKVRGVGLLNQVLQEWKVEGRRDGGRERRAG